MKYLLHYYRFRIIKCCILKIHNKLTTEIEYKRTLATYPRLCPPIYFLFNTSMFSYAKNFTCINSFIYSIRNVHFPIKYFQNTVFIQKLYQSYTRQVFHDKIIPHTLWCRGNYLFCGPGFGLIISG